MTTTTTDTVRVAGRITFVIPTKNNERTIAACVASARNQCGDVEVIVVDNYSTDATAQLARDNGADRVMIAGPERSAQRNRGFAASSGGVVAFIDSDMVLEPGVADDLRTAFGDRSVGGAVVPETAFGVGYLAGCRALEKRLYLGLASAEAARAFRAEALDRVGAYDEARTATEDYELADRVRSAGWQVSRSVSGVRHDEGRVRLGDLWRKKRYYGSTWHLLEPGRLDRSRLRRFPFRPRLLLSDPWHVPGLVLLKVVDLSGLAAGHLAARRSSRASGPVGAPADRAAG